MLSLLRLERKQKNSSNPFRIHIFLFLSYSFGIGTINTFIHARSSLENHTRFQTKMVKVYTHFQTKRAQNPTRWGGTYLYSLYKGVSPGTFCSLVRSTGRDLHLFLAIFSILAKNFTFPSRYLKHTSSTCN